MTTEELARRRAWAAIHFGDKDLTDAELATATYMPSENFSDGWDKGSEWALSNQWVSVDEWLPEDNDYVLAHVPQRVLPAYNEVSYWDGEDWYTQDGELIRPSHWLPIPQLNPEKEER